MTVELSILDVGHGNCAVLNDDGKITVFDAGLGSSLLEFLTQEGISKIDTLLISHADEDHVGGVVGLVGSEIVEIDAIYLNSDSTKTVKNGRRWKQLLYSLNKAKQSGKLNFFVGLTTSNTGEFDGPNIKIELLAPSPYLAALAPGGKDVKDRTLSSNTLSAVFRLMKDSESAVLLAGDLDDVGLQNLIEDEQTIEASVLLFPHHGGLSGGNVTKFTEQICGLTAATTVVFSNGRDHYGAPRPEVVEAVRKTLSEARILCTQLSRVCAANDLTDQDQSYLSPKFARGRSRKKCCAGTVVFDLLQKEIVPVYAGHSEFIQIGAPTAMCRSKSDS